MNELVAHIRQALTNYRLTFGDELGLQNELEMIFALEGIELKREFQLSKRDRPDFFVMPGGYAIEVKVGGAIDSYLRQVKRYNDHAAVAGTILIATRPFSVPSTLSGKPVACINVGGNRL